MNGLGEAFPLVIAAPSGTGKTSLAHALVSGREDAVFSVSATTREARPGEQDGVDYHFVSDAEFDRMQAAGELLEWAHVHANRYGTPWSSIRDAMGGGRTVVLDIDIQGARQVRRAFERAVLVYILPPSGLELHRRLAGRGSEARAELERRLTNAVGELEAVAEFDYVVVNDDFELALERLGAIFQAERNRVARIPDLTDRVRVIKDEIRNLLEGE